SDLPEETLRYLRDLDVWIIDALRYTTHPSHLSVDQALSWIECVRPKRAILTHMHVDLDYEELKQKLPSDIEPAYDGMVLTTAGGSVSVFDNLSSVLVARHGEGYEGSGDVFRRKQRGRILSGIGLGAHPRGDGA